MTLSVYHLKTCDTCRKAIKALTQSGLSPELIDVRADGVSESQIKYWAETLGYEAVLNTRSTTWRGLEASEKTDVNLEKAVALIAEHPTLIKRPIITDGHTITVGWKTDAQDVWLS
ncbi:arsenate reductase [Litorimonas taeanensis]|uniref:Arsenate reductase n=1 Tax=Litorimonas taeanensis TaxID=568099 RepID=A0A420WDA2_9PROT|nr:Spx/MgsR family RNA polymerase-binding regulatory protein [Litorimonas taeanensis]RKQ69014.1 arsenate reductase [Litorimonas taeanensis]